MSAYVVDREDIHTLVRAALSSSGRTYSAALRWLWNIDRGAGTYDSNSLHDGDMEAATTLGQMLREENIKSVLYRYPDCTRDDMPGPIGEDFVYGFEFDSRQDLTPGMVFDLIGKYEYQSCEHDEWPTSEAYAFCDALRRKWCRIATDKERPAEGAEGGGA